MKNKITGHKPNAIKPGFLHLLVPANKPDVQLCKTIVSSVLAGFPTPTIINWGRSFDNPKLIQGGSHIGKLKGVSQYLKKLDSSHDEDLVLVVDAFDIWFQLGPQVLIDRYHELARESNMKLEKRLGKRAVRELGIRQSIVFGAQKECWPGDQDDINCYASPNSTLPGDIYGPDTDTLIDEPQNPSARFRQRYLNSGFVMGTLAEMRTLYERAMIKSGENPKLESDQTIFSGIFGEQEYQREVIRLRYLTGWQRFRMWWQDYLRVSEPSILDPHPSRYKMEPVVEGAPYELGIGLDYTSALGQNTIFSHRDSDWLSYNDTTTIVEAYDNMDVTSPGAYEINEDVATSLPPFWTTTRLDIILPSQRTWQDVWIYTNLYTGISPVMIHHNAHQKNLKMTREKKWDKMWFHPHIRDFLTARLHEPYLPVAVTGPRNAEKAWWGPVEKRSYGLGAQPDYSMSDWLHWSDLASEDWANEIFRDDRGLWKEE